MYLNKIELNTKKTKALLALRNPNLIHGALASHYPEEPILWRIDEIGSKRNLLLQTEHLLSFSPLVEQFGKENHGAATVNLQPIFNLVKEDTQWKFRLKANPVYRTVNKKTGRKAYCHYMNDKDRLAWLENRSEKNGFKIDSVHISSIQNIRFKRNGSQVSLAAVTYDGILTVTNQELFLHTLEHGLGHGKAYGLGLLSLAPL
ncbi:type I-E CRISPR-associated protein Cas6/Cse3/CasE [Erysipelotrichaceae bacterium RD49]|nr:type I-E CRISPR-associated protein Cas6/Cse3/CasE [Erysipelotrichaceae bacterium RD49]